MRYCLLLTILLIPDPPVAAQEDDGLIPELVVTSQRRAQAPLLLAGNLRRLGAETMDRARHQHIHELLARVPGTWITRASGQEHLTAIRSPVLTGAGSCGAFLFLEDGIPIRPAGFCNVNALFEAGTELARAVEVVRGPGNALYGSNALHGIVNVLLPDSETHAPYAAVEAGANDYYRIRASLPFHRNPGWLASLVYADDGGFRDAAGYRQAKVHLRGRWNLARSDLTVAVSASDLDQQTAGFILGEDAYRDNSLNRGNLNPEAFRVASSARAYAHWSRSFDRFEINLRPYLRRTEMRFLQHFLPGQPLEENGHVSGGIIASATIGGATHTTIVGIDLEWADVYLEETQDAPTEGSPFLVETRPQGKHYDYDVTSAGVAAYLQSDIELNDRLTLGAGVRVDRIHYDYDNRMLPGNTRDDGSVCGFGGCLYSRPADRSDGFTNVAPKLSLNFRLDGQTSVYASAARGFRAPQSTELYRLQSGQQVADLGSERIDNIELGWKAARPGWSAEAALFAAEKRNSIYRDAEGFNVSGARSTHRGVEAAIKVQLGTAWTLAVDASYALHRYDFDAVAARGETFVSGNDVDTAPRLLGNAELIFDPAGRVDASMNWTRIGAYYLDAENRFRYPGHTTGNLRVGIAVTDRVGLALRLNNIADRDNADRADFAFGNHRYFPGRGREFFAEIRYTPNESL